MKYIKEFWSKCKTHQKTLILLIIYFMTLAILSISMNIYSERPLHSRAGYISGYVVWFVIGFALNHCIELYREGKDEQGGWKAIRKKSFQTLNRKLNKLGFKYQGKQGGLKNGTKKETN